jgi:hypothetical protein
MQAPMDYFVRYTKLLGEANILTSSRSSKTASARCCTHYCSMVVVVVVIMMRCCIVMVVVYCDVSPSLLSLPVTV